MDDLYLDQVIKGALKEDMPFGDITTDSVFDEEHHSEAYMVAKQEGIICGIKAAIRTFEILDEDIIVEYEIEDGDPVKPGDIVLEIQGRTRAILKGERTALNILQRLSGIATVTYDFVKEVEGFDVRIADTRKTTPLLRLMEKYAVTCGGGANHRFCLSDAVMIKDNHIEAMGGIKKAVEVLRKKIPHTLKIEVEADNMEKVKQAVLAGADIIMLDNMDTEAMKAAVDFINKRVIVEASGNVTKEKLREIAETGVDVISSGKLTHSVQALDISMKIRKDFKAL
jgi:nicotinate-nucleotide pyrophosphorylase (carboxylating)